jgi:hypothetical protein
MITRKQSHLALYTTLALMVIVGLYGLFQARHLIEGPIIVLETPQNGSMLTQSLVTIRGTARNTAKIALNGKDILPDMDGHFSEELLLSEGYNIITVEASDQFGKRTHKTLEVMYQQTSPSVHSTNAGKSPIDS